MNVFNIVYGPVASGKTYFVMHCAKPSDIIFDNVGIEVIENVTLWNTFCKRYDDAMFWIVLDLTRVSMAQFNTIQMFFVKYGVVNQIEIRLPKRGLL